MEMLAAKEGLRAALETAIEVEDDPAAADILRSKLPPVPKTKADKKKEEANKKTQDKGAQNKQPQGKQEGKQDGKQGGKQPQGKQEGKQEGKQDGKHCEQQEVEQGGAQQGKLEAKQQGVQHGKQPGLAKANSACAAAPAQPLVPKTPLVDLGICRSGAGIALTIGRCSDLVSVTLKHGSEGWLAIGLKKPQATPAHPAAPGHPAPAARAALAAMNPSRLTPASSATATSATKPATVASSSTSRPEDKFSIYRWAHRHLVIT